ncbi:MCE family protein [Mycobacterium paraintracellulare]|uniref:MCE family protein n=1 Tax=Mycobacterium paraintracellulare TaxID=1138383 RepID=UPI00192852E4|nr:MCE family protein [Mycobacterium paraintracellulare]
MKSFSERSSLLIGAAGAAAVAAITIGALEYQKLPFFNQGKNYSAYFADAGGLHTGAVVEVSGYPAGKVSRIELDGTGVLVTFQLDKHIRVGDHTEAAIKARSLLGTKVLDVTPRGEGPLKGAIPIDRTASPYQLPDALGDLATTISGLNTDQLSDSLATLAQTFSTTPPDLRSAVQGLARFAQTINSRDAHLRNLLDNAAKATGVLAKRSDQVVSLVTDTNALLVQVRTQSAALDQIWANVSAVSRQLKGFIADNRRQLQPALNKLDEVLSIIDKRKERLQQAIPGLNRYVMQLSETISQGPFFNVYVSNLLPGQFVQPFVNAAFSDLGLDPATLLPSELTDPPTGQPGIPALPMPYPRTGQGGGPRLNLPDAITGNPDPNLPGQFPGRYPYRPELPAPPPGGPPPGPPALPPPGLQSTPEPTPSPVYVPAPGEAPPTSRPGG